MISFVLLVILTCFCYYILSHVYVVYGGKGRAIESSEEGPPRMINPEIYDRDHMGYTQKVTSFSRT